MDKRFWRSHQMVFPETSMQKKFPKAQWKHCSHLHISEHDVRGHVANLLHVKCCVMFGQRRRWNVLSRKNTATICYNKQMLMSKSKYNEGSLVSVLHTIQWKKSYKLQLKLSTFFRNIAFIFWGKVSWKCSLTPQCTSFIIQSHC